MILWLSWRLSRSRPGPFVWPDVWPSVTFSSVVTDLVFNSCMNLLVNMIWGKCAKVYLLFVLTWARTWHQIRVSSLQLKCQKKVTELAQCCSCWLHLRKDGEEKPSKNVNVTFVSPVDTVYKSTISIYIVLHNIWIYYMSDLMMSK